MKEKQLDILIKVEKGEFTPIEAQKQLCFLFGVNGSSILENRPNLQNLQRNDYHKHKQNRRFNLAVKCNVINLWRYGYLAGYAYAVRRLKNV